MLETIHDEDGCYTVVVQDDGTITLEASKGTQVDLTVEEARAAIDFVESQDEPEETTESIRSNLRVAKEAYHKYDIMFGTDELGYDERLAENPLSVHNIPDNGHLVSVRQHHLEDAIEVAESESAMAQA